MAGSRPNQRVSILEIAAEAGVSTSTVSKVLNGYKDFSVRPEVRANILALVKRRSYSPNPVFRSLRAEKSRQISFLFQGTSPFMVGVVVNQAVETMGALLAGHGYQLNYTFYQKGGDSVRYLPPWKVDGIVLSDVTHATALDGIAAMGTPFVVLNGESGQGGPAVKIDEAAGMGQAIAHLRELGHTRIAYANGEDYGHYSVADRHHAYLQHLAAAGLPPWPGHDHLGSDPADFLRRQVLAGGATALIAYDHFLALRYLHAAWELGIAVPQRLSVVAFNDESRIEIAIPPLTCIASPAAAMGEKTVALLLAQIADPDAPRNLEVRIPGRLIVRQSTASPAAP